MRVQITEILYDGVTEAYTVSFLSPFGAAVGRWGGEEPEMYRSYDVDLTVEPPLIWGETIEITLDDRSLLDIVNEQLIIQGKLETAEPDGVIYVRLGSDLVLLETVGEVPNEDVYVRAKPALLALFPYEL